jgi:hypothetical protein
MLDAFSETIELTLIGKADQLFFDQHLSVRPYVQVEAPVKSEALHRSLSRFDIGLAVEDINAGLNRNICLTNKIFAYLQAGLLILATATEAQKKFLAQNPAAGYIIDEPAFPVLMNKIILEKELIRENKKKRSDAAARFCWENESLLLLEKWKSVTGKKNNS